MKYKFSLLVCLTIGYIGALTPIKASPSQQELPPSIPGSSPNKETTQLTPTASSELLNTHVQRVDPFGLIQLMQYALDKKRNPIGKKSTLIKADVSFLQTCFTPLHTLEFNIKQFVSKGKSDPNCKNNKEILLNALKEISMQLEKELNTVKTTQGQLEKADCSSAIRVNQRSHRKIKTIQQWNRKLLNALRSLEKPFKKKN